MLSVWNGLYLSCYRHAFPFSSIQIRTCSIQTKNKKTQGKSIRRYGCILIHNFGAHLQLCVMCFFEAMTSMHPFISYGSLTGFCVPKTKKWMNTYPKVYTSAQGLCIISVCSWVLLQINVYFKLKKHKLDFFLLLQKHGVVDIVRLLPVSGIHIFSAGLVWRT